jgi:hypothetical protein
LATLSFEAGLVEDPAEFCVVVGMLEPPPHPARKATAASVLAATRDLAGNSSNEHPPFESRWRFVEYAADQETD